MAAFWTSSRGPHFATVLYQTYTLPPVDSLLAAAAQQIPDVSPFQLLPQKPPFEIGLFGVQVTGGFLLLVEIVFLLVLQFVPETHLSNFAARKTCHACTGMLVFTLNPADDSARMAVWLMGFGLLLMTWDYTKQLGIPPFRFGTTRDIGISVYIVIVMAWFHARMPPAALAPLFFADPAGAVVGKFLSRKVPKQNPRWYSNKTVGGSCAVCIVTFLALTVFYPPIPVHWRLLLSIVAMLAEAVGGAYDNLCQAAVVLLGYYYLVP